MRRAFLVLTFLAPWAAAQQPPAPASLPRSPLVWEVREGTHPRMGPITVAVPSDSVVTPVGKEKILSLVFFSCEKTAGRIAIELANAAESDARSGLYPKQMPKLFCNPRSTAPRSEIGASWYVSEIGDALARGLVPSDLRRCASIEIQQDLALPRGWGPEVQHVEIEVIPYKKELDTVLAACAVPQPQLRAEASKASDAEKPAALQAKSPAPTPPQSVKVPAPPPKAVPTPPPTQAAATPPSTQPATLPPTQAAAIPQPAKAMATPAPTPATPAKAATSEPPWKQARVVAVGGRTNVRASPSTSAPIVTILDPGAVIQVQSTGTEWWRVRPSSGAGFSGYIRQDRLVLP